MARALALLAALAVGLSGCLGPAGDLAPSGGVPPPLPAAAPSHVLAQALEPEGLEAPVFDLLESVARGGPGFSHAEPSLWAHLDGTLYIAAPGCDKDDLDMAQQSKSCVHGLVFRSTDGGATWERLNDPEDGSLVKDRDSRANGDAEVAVDAAGNVYVSNLGAGIPVLGSSDQGASWAYIGDVVPEDHWADRQWMAAGKAGHLVVTWMGGEDFTQRAVAVNTTWDGGRTWSGTTYLGENIGWLGPVVLDPAGEAAYIPFTQPEEPLVSDPVFGFLELAGERTFHVLVARSADGGASWDVVDTGARVVRTHTGLHWSGVLMAPAMDVTGDGTLVVAWSEDVRDPTGATSLGAVVKTVASKDQGATWTAPVDVSSRPTAIMPWVTGGAGDRAAFTYYASDVPLDSDYAGSWDVEATVMDGLGGGEVRAVTSLVEAGVHQGGLCARGGLCFITASDRTLLDFFEADLLPDGRLAIVYPADPVQGGKYVDLRFALQSGGTPLLAKP